MTSFTTGQAQPAFQNPSDIVKLEDACKRRLNAERTLALAKQNSDRAREDAIPLFRSLGVTEVAVDSEGIRFVPTKATVTDEDAIEAYVKRYAPDHYDLIFPPVRSLDASALKMLVKAGTIKDTVLKHIQTIDGSPRLSRYDVK